MKSNLYKVILLLTVCVMLGAISAAQPASADILYTITDLGPGTARDINNLGQVVGDAFFWDSSTGRQNVSPGLESINDSGLAISTTAIWDSLSGQWVGSFPLFGGIAINNSGQVAGYDNESRACIWDSVNGKQCISSINGAAKDINDSGQICVWRGHTYESLVWDSVNGIQYIPTLGGAYSEALGMNNLGQVVGTSTIAMTSSPKHTFIWDKYNGTRDLGSVYGSAGVKDNSEAFDINILGQIVGRSSPLTPESSHGGWIAFVGTETNGLQDLNSLIPPGTGWILGTAFAINDQGQIVGYAALEGEEHAYLLTPLPSPIPHMIVSPIGYDFERVVVEHSSDPLAINIYNYGDVDLVVSDMSLSDNINFFLDGDTTPTIEPGGSHVVTVTFSPQSMGQHNATLSIASNAPLKPNVEVQLVGEGEAVIWGCINFQGSPLANAKVRLKQKGGKNQTTMTNSVGCYYFDILTADKGCGIQIDFPPLPK